MLPSPSRAGLRIARTEGSANLSPSDIDRGIEAWLRLGSSERAAAEIGCSPRAIRNLRTLHPDRYAEICRAYTHAREAATFSLLNALAADAHDARSVLRAGMAGKATAEQVAAAREVMKACSLFDKTERLDRGRPTEITEAADKRSDDEIAASLAAVAAERASLANDRRSILAAMLENPDTRREVESLMAGTESSHG